MVTLNKIYTKTGDGRNRAGRRQPRAKYALRIAAIGAVDETNAAIGIARLDAEGDMDAMLARIQNDLFDLGADLCAPEDGRKAEGRACASPTPGRTAGARDRRHERRRSRRSNLSSCRAARRWRRICIWPAPSRGARNG